MKKQSGTSHSFPPYSSYKKAFEKPFAFFFRARTKETLKNPSTFIRKLYTMQTLS